MADRELQYRATQILRKAIDEVLVVDPFFGHIMDQMRLEPDARKDVPTIGTNGKLLVYDSKWVVEQERRYPGCFKTIMAHEAAHVALGHPYRGIGMDQDRYGKASDAVVNGLLQKRGYEMPPDSFMYPNAARMTTEEVYRQLMENGGQGNNEKGEAKGTPQNFGTTFSPDEGTDAEEEAKAKAKANGDGQGQGQGEGEQDPEDQVRENVARAAQRARKEGRMPGELEDLIRQSLMSKKDWRDEMKLFLGGGEMKTESWSRPNRRFLHQDTYLPGRSKFGPGQVVLAVDVSGSIDRSLLEKFLAEVRKVNIDLQPDAIHVMTCDTRVPWRESFGPYDDVAVPGRAITGGGTRFSPVFEEVEKNGWSPKALVYFTDLECSDFGKKPDYPVLWVVWPGGRTHAPWGKIVQMDD